MARKTYLVLKNHNLESGPKAYLKEPQQYRSHLGFLLQVEVDVFVERPSSVSAELEIVLTLGF